MAEDLSVDDTGAASLGASLADPLVVLPVLAAAGAFSSVGPITSTLPLVLTLLPFWGEADAAGAVVAVGAVGVELFSGIRGKSDSDSVALRLVISC